MIRAAGVLLRTSDNKALFLKRSSAGDAQGYWCFPGGKIEANETPEQAARRECIEEVGSVPDGELELFTRSIREVPQPLAAAPITVAPAPSEPVVSVPSIAEPQMVDFTTYQLRNVYEFQPKLDHEHVAYAWAPVDQPPEPLHPGCVVTLARDSMNEQQVAQAIAAGELTSPQQFANSWLWAMRVTGTGLAYRHKHQEHVWRDPSLYMTPEFLSRCTGLPVIIEHPPKAVLDSKEFGRRIVGTIIYPYLKPEVEEVWGIARILDEPTNNLLSEEQMSTSPAVVFRDPEVNEKTETEHGTLLVEGEPSLLDHLAICEQGVWDKGGLPSGIQSATIGDMIMADDNKKDDKVKTDIKADSARADADTKLDNLIGLMGTAIGRFDSIDTRLADLESRVGAPRADADEKEEKKDDAEDDKEEKKDDAEEEKEEKADAMLDKKLSKQDADEKDKKEDDEDMMEACDTDEAGEYPEKANEVAADKKSRKDSKRGDSVFDRMNRLESLIRQPSDSEFAALADAQEQADHVFSAFGDSAPRPLAGETTLNYRLRMVSKLQSHSPTWKGTNLSILAKADAVAFGNVEKAIYADALKAADKPVDLKPGQFREVVRQDATGRRISTFKGSRSFVNQFKPKVRRVTNINTRFNER